MCPPADQFEKRRREGVRMVFESWPWKQDLLRQKNSLIRYNTADNFSKNEERAYTVVEKSIFYSAFIIRKLIDCKGKLSDEADKYAIHVKLIRPLKHIDIMHCWPDEHSHDWEHESSVTVKGKDICNWLIHSYIFFTEFDESNSIKSFYVSSDYDKNSALYKILLADWLAYVDFIASDDIVQMDSHFDSKKNEYIFTRKKRGDRTIRRQ